MIPGKDERYSYYSDFKKFFKTIHSIGLSKQAKKNPEKPQL